MTNAAAINSAPVNGVVASGKVVTPASSGWTGTLNGAPLNTAQINGAGPVGTPGEDGQIVARAPLRLVLQRFVVQPAAPLRLSLLPDVPQHGTFVMHIEIDGVDVSERITGIVRIQAQEGAARIATLSFVPRPGPIDLARFMGLAVTIDVGYAGAPLVRRFTGMVEEPVFDPDGGVLSLVCTDGLQAKIDAMGEDAIRSLIPGAQVSHVVMDEGRSGWDRAQDLVVTTVGVIDADANGAPRWTPWAVPVDAVTRSYGKNNYLDGTLRVEMSQFSRMPPRVVIDMSYRYPRLKVRGVRAQWAYPWGTSFSGVNGLRYLSADTVLQAIESTGAGIEALVFERYAEGWQPLPGGGYIWYDPALVSGFDGLVSRRYVQWINEHYRITIENPYAPAAAQAGAFHEQASLAVEFDVAEWERGARQHAENRAALLDYLPTSEPEVVPHVPPPTGPGERYHDVTDGDRDGRGALEGAIAVLVGRAQRRIQEGLRASTVTFSVPFDPLVDIPDIVAIDAENVRAFGKVRALTDTFDVDAATADTEIAIAVCPVPGADADVLAVVPAPVWSIPIAPQELLTTPGSWLGSAQGSTDLDPGMVGFFTNAAPSAHPDSVYDANAPVYPEHFTIELPEIADMHREMFDTDAVELVLSAGSPGGDIELEAT